MPDVEKLDRDHWGLDVYEVDSVEYAVGTDEQCDEFNVLAMRA